MKILVVSERSCIRTLKQLLALGAKHEVHLITKRISGYPNVRTTTYYNGEVDSLANALLLYKDVDIVYAASEPSWVLFEIKRVLSNKKVVLDIHDAQIWRSKEPELQSAEERLAFNWADALVVPSETCKEILQREFLLSKQPIVVLPPYVNEHFYDNIAWVRKGGIVYQGRIDIPSSPDFMNYTKMDKLAKELNKNGIPFHIYCPLNDRNEELKSIYEPIAIWHKGKSYENLIKTLGFHDWGICGNLDQFREWDLAMPNKLFEYMAGGIPIIALNAKESGNFIEKHGIGISVRTIDEIKTRWDEREQCQRNVFLKRFDFTMEKHIHIVEDLLKNCLS